MSWGEILITLSATLDAFTMSAWAVHYFRRYRRNPAKRKADLNDAKWLRRLALIAFIGLGGGLVGIWEERTERASINARLQGLRDDARDESRAMAGDLDSYDRLVTLGHENSERGAAARARVESVRVQLAATYDQPFPGMREVPGAMTGDGKNVPIETVPAATLLEVLASTTTTTALRLQLMPLVCARPIGEVDAAALALLTQSKHLPGVAALTSILGRVHQHAQPFLDAPAWIAFLKSNGGGTGG